MRTISKVSNEEFLRKFSVVLILLGSIVLSIIVTTTITPLALPFNEMTSLKHSTKSLSSMSNRLQDVTESARIVRSHSIPNQQHDMKQTGRWSFFNKTRHQPSLIHQFSRNSTKVETKSHLNAKNDGFPVTLTDTGTPIRIDGNADFHAQAAANGWSGNGTAGNPYVIENLMIVTTQNGTNAIDIRNTNVHFIIRNCTITATGYSVNGTYPSGIYLYNVTNARLEHNNASNSRYYGFYLWCSSNNMLVNNIASHDGEKGFYLRASSNTTLINNVALNSIDGFYLGAVYLWCSANNNTLVNNTASHNSAGFYLWYGANHTTLINNVAFDNIIGFSILSNAGNTLINNTASYNIYRGFSLSSSMNNLLVNNTASHNNDGFSLNSDSNNNRLFNNAAFNNIVGFHSYNCVDNGLANNTASRNRYGFYLYNSANTTLMNNIVSHNTYYGFYLTDAGFNNVVMYNDLLFNNDGGVQAYSTNSTNVFDYNFWSDHLTPDDDDDGIVDIPYTIDGGSGVIDSHPVTRPHYQFPPFPPQNLQAVAGDRRVRLSWSAPASDGGSPLTEYRVYRSTFSGSGYVLVASVDGSTTTYTDSSVSNGVTYYYVVRAVNAIGESVDSEEVRVTPATVPSAPQNLQAVAEDGQITLSWSAPASDGGSPLTEYRVYRSTSSGSGYVLVASVDNSITTYTDSSVSNGVTYYYVVRAVNAIGESVSSNAVSITLQAPSSSITITTTTNTTTNGATSSNDGSSISHEVTTTRTIVVNTSSWSFAVFVVAIFVVASWMTVMRRGRNENS